MNIATGPSVHAGARNVAEARVNSFEQSPDFVKNSVGFLPLLCKAPSKGPFGIWSIFALHE